MDFTFKKRKFECKHVNLRAENDGPNAKRPAVDISMRWAVTKAEELDMICPTQNIPLSEFIYDKKANLSTHLLPSIKVARKPEDIRLRIYDKELLPKDFLEFKEANFKDIVIEFEQDGVAYCTAKAQIRPSDPDYERLAHIIGQTREFECKSMSPELFDLPAEEDEEDEVPAGEQTDIEGDEAPVEKPVKPKRKRASKAKD